MLRACGLHDCLKGRLFRTGESLALGDVEVSSFPVEHDAISPVGFRIEVRGRIITIATDLGNATSEVRAAIGLADLVVLEANHDLEMLERGRYPQHLRRRVAGPKGHLSNSQAAVVLAQHVKAEETEIWLAHLSKENNTPALALRTVRHCLKGAGMASAHVGVALRDRPSMKWNGESRPRQLSLFAGMN
ncbi:MAG: hypothetical protein NVSMB52_04130 [Chloroflexota bacterium]